MGAKRELKFALEKFWRGEVDAEHLETVARDLRARHWRMQREAGLDMVTVGDFALYDHMANHIQLLGCEPARFGFTDEDELTRYFVMARGGADTDDGAERHALEMTKWFDTNYHYLVPEFTAETRFHLASERLFREIDEARALGHTVKPVLVGPLTFLSLGKSRDASLDVLALIPGCVSAYVEIVSRLHAMGVEWVQIDEPILGLDLPNAWRDALGPAYEALAAAGPNILLATYFSPLNENVAAIVPLPVAGLHVDAVRAVDELDSVAAAWPADKVLSVGIVDGRNIWRTDLDAALARLRPLAKARPDMLWLAPSCSLLHVPLDLSMERKLDPELTSWLAFARRKMEELNTLRRAVASGEEAVSEALSAARSARENREASPRAHRPAVAHRLSDLPEAADRRLSPFPERQARQRDVLNLPAFPTTTIGSFPQTPEIRAARAGRRRGEISVAEYDEAMRAEIANTIRIQEELGIDVLVHGEAERNDMVEYFGEKLDGFAFTQHGWVQSYGSRCVKPPVIFGDVQRPQAMTVEWITYAQSLTTHFMKGMLTGPVTMLEWSFVRDDQPRETTCLQIALAIRDEVADLEKAGIRIIQIDEPALREGLPLRRSEWDSYVEWATRCFRIAAGGAGDATQIHTHMCYAEFNDILPAIAGMDADVITFESSRSEMELLHGFRDFAYPGEIGPGVWDIHSPRVSDADEMERRMRKAAAVLPPENLWVNPDCGLKTRAWPETEAGLRNLAEAARRLRAAADTTHR
jgi:5-methyltetrahydropteroyltriglutamate--homocysteine methyltransferase